MKRIGDVFRLLEQPMKFKRQSILVTSTFLLGVATWYGARFWTFGDFSLYHAIPFLLATALVVSMARGNRSSFWLMALFSAAGAYASFNLFFYLKSTKFAGPAYIVPGCCFSLCLMLMLVEFLVKYTGNRRSP